MDRLAFDLVVATVDRSDDLGLLLHSLARQTHRRFRVVIVDQNDDERLAPVLARHRDLEIVHLRAERRGLSRARNSALGHLQADVIAFPDDDCTYPPDLLERVASTLSARPELDGILGRTEDSIGRSSANWASVRQRVTRNNVWHCSNSNSIFLGRDLLERLGSFDEALGLGSRWSSGEETELLVRAVDLGAELEYDPSLVVVHADRALSPDVGLRDGASVGYILGKHSYPRRAFARMTVRAVGGAAASLLRLDVERARFHAATFRGRVSGYRAGVKAGREGA